MDFTVDIDDRASPDFHGDIIFYNSNALQIACGQVDEGVFKYLNRGPKNPFNDAHFNCWLRATHQLLKLKGIVKFYNFDQRYLDRSIHNMLKAGFRNVESHKTPPTPQSTYGHRYAQGVK